MLYRLIVMISARELRRLGILWSVQDVADEYGVTHRTIRKQLHRLPPRSKIGGQWYWLREDMAEVVGVMCSRPKPGRKASEWSQLAWVSVIGLLDQLGDGNTEAAN